MSARRRCAECGATYEGVLDECPLDGGRLTVVAHDAWIGRVLAERYRLDARLGEGATATVFAGIDLHDGSAVALKLLEPLRSDVERERFVREARAVSEVHHPHVVEVSDVGFLEDGRGFLVMPRLNGVPLTALCGTPVDPTRALGLLRPVAAGLAAAHGLGVVHRDVKPANIFVLEAPPDVRILDFGMARILGESPITESGLVVGTPAYMSPEQAEGRRATPASDVYALGVTLFELVTGRRPFVGDTVEVLQAHVDREPPTPSTIRAELPVPIDALILAAMDKRASRRPSAAAVEAAMAAWLEARSPSWAWALSLLGRLHEVAFGEPLELPSPSELAGDPFDVLSASEPGRPEESFGEVLAEMREIEARLELPAMGVLTPELADQLAALGRDAERWRRLQERLIGLRRAADGHASDALGVVRSACERLATVPAVAPLLPRRPAPSLRTRGT